MARRLLVSLLVFLCAISLKVCAAETVVTIEGTQITGDVSFDGEVYIVKSPNGMETKLPRDFVKQVLMPESAEKAFGKRVDALRQSNRKSDANEWYKLGAFAQVCGVDGVAQTCFEQVLALDANHIGARTALGYNLVKGQWVKEDPQPADAAPHMLRSGGAPQTPTFGKAADANAVPPASKKAAPGAKPGRVLIQCPDCLGTGVSTWITCGQCERSGQPGFVYLGEKYEICPRCNGAGRWPALRCKRCLGTGKIDPDKQQVQSQDKKQPPPGFHFCTKCDGTGFDEWAPCDKCAWRPCEFCAKSRDPKCDHCGGLGKVKSLIPGYVYVRGNQVKCDKCQGLGKIPLKRCSMCGSTGVIRDP